MPYWWVTGITFLEGNLAVTIKMHISFDSLLGRSPGESIIYPNWKQPEVYQCGPDWIKRCLRV